MAISAPFKSSGGACWFHGNVNEKGSPTTLKRYAVTLRADGILHKRECMTDEEGLSFRGYSDRTPEPRPAPVFETSSDLRGDPHTRAIYMTPIADSLFVPVSPEPGNSGEFLSLPHEPRHFQDNTGSILPDRFFTVATKTVHGKSSP